MMLQDIFLTDFCNLFQALAIDTSLGKSFQKRAKTSDWNSAENDRTRYTTPLQARKELLTRLLHHQRAGEEVACQAAQSPATKVIKPRKVQRTKKEDDVL